jgi:hypothetical protein
MTAVMYTLHMYLIVFKSLLSILVIVMISVVDPYPRESLTLLFAGSGSCHIFLLSTKKFEDIK